MASSPIKYTDGTTPCEGAAAPEVLSYSEDEEDEWMPFRRSAPDSVGLQFLVLCTSALCIHPRFSVA